MFGAELRARGLVFFPARAPIPFPQPSSAPSHLPCARVARDYATHFRCCLEHCRAFWCFFLLGVDVRKLCVPMHEKKSQQYFDKIIALLWERFLIESGRHFVHVSRYFKFYFLRGRNELLVCVHVCICTQPIADSFRARELLFILCTWDAELVCTRPILTSNE